MTLKNILFILFIFKASTTFSQNCDCKATFEWVKETFENNDAGFQYIIDKKGEELYNVHNQMYFTKVNLIENPEECETIIREWLTFF